jgi:D-alanyl-D-alanine carboxypeptidase
MRIQWVVLLALATAALLPDGIATAQAPAAETPATRQLALWLDTFNSGNREQHQRFVREHWPSRPNQSVEQDLAFLEQTGGFDLIRIEEATSTRAVALVQERDSDTVARLEIEVDAREPHHFVSVGARVIPRPPDLAIPRLSETELVRALSVEIERRAGAGRFSGTVLLARNGEPIFTAAVGLADRVRNTPNSLDTRFRNGSMNKMFTAVAVLKLAQDGELSLDDPIGRYLTDYPNEALASSVTIHHLLTHTGGTGDIFGPEFGTNRLALRTHQDYLNLFGERQLQFEPGSQWRYSNYGYVLLGALIGQVSGQSYYDYVREHVYEPAGMHATGSEPEDMDVPNRSIGYMRSPSGLLPNTDTLPYRGMAAGGGSTTVGDLLRFANALTRHVLLNEEYTALLTAGKVVNGPTRYAYGFVEQTSGGEISFGHAGGAPGMNGDLRIFPRSGYVVAVLANMDPPAAQRIVDFIVNRLPARAGGDD